LAARAERIFLGEVLTRTTGKDPLGHPATVYTFRVEQVLKGPLTDTVTIKQIGVAYPAEDPDTGIITFPIEGVPVYEPGHRYLLFLNGTSDIGFTSPVGLGYGAFVVLPNGRVVNDLNNAGLLRDVSSSFAADAGELMRHKRGPIQLSHLLEVVPWLVRESSPAQISTAVDPVLLSLEEIKKLNPGALFNGHPFRWNIPSAANPGGTLSAVPYDVETGPLGSASNVSARAKVAESFGKWAAPETTTMIVTSTPGTLGVDVDANCPSPTCYLNWFFVFGDGKNPIIFDNDGSISNAITGSPCTFGGWAGFQGQTFDAGSTWTMEGTVVLNGAFLGGVCGSRTLDEFGLTITHEVGHFLALGHTIVNGELIIANESFLDFSVPPCSSVEVMLSNPVPGCTRPNVLQKVDILNISYLYPSADFAATTGKITGRLSASDGVTPVNCGNVILRNSDDPFFDAVAFITGISKDSGTPPPGQNGSYQAPGLTLGASYILGVNQIPAFAGPGRSLTKLCDPIPTLPGPEEFYNGTHENSDSSIDNPACFTPVTASSSVSDINIILNSTPSSNAPCSILVIGASSLPEGEVGIAYNASLEVSGDSPPYIISVVKGFLPSGLGLGNDGVISGTPDKAGTKSFTVKVTDSAGSSVFKKLKIKVFKLLSISTKSLKAGKVGKSYSATLKAAGGKKPYSWSILSGSLPEGLVLDGATGKITGTPVVPGSSELAFRVTDPLGGVAEKAFTLTIN
jgi:hypothetical protein